MCVGVCESEDVSVCVRVRVRESVYESGYERVCEYLCESVCVGGGGNIYVSVCKCLLECEGVCMCVCM